MTKENNKLREFSFDPAALNAEVRDVMLQMIARNGALAKDLEYTKKWAQFVVISCKIFTDVNSILNEKGQELSELGFGECLNAAYDFVKEKHGIF